MDSLFSGLITSKMRIRILTRLFQNPDQQAYLRELAQDFDASPSQVREELRRLSGAGLLRQRRDGRQVFYSANTEHALFPELQSIVRKALGMDRILESIIERLGNLDLALLLDDYAQGKDTGIVDLVLVGDVNRANLDDITAKTERYIGRKIRTLVVSAAEFGQLRSRLEQRPHLVLWRNAGA